MVEIRRIEPLIFECHWGTLPRIAVTHPQSGGKGMLKLPFLSARYFFFAVIFSAVAVKATSELELRAVSVES